MIRALILGLALALALPLAAPAQTATVAEAPDEPRIRALAQTLRCPVCQSESILESRSSTAYEMMVILREMVAEGRGDAEIVEFFRSRYGNYVMLAPPRNGPGGVIWLLAPTLLAGGGGFFLWRLRQRGAVVEVPAQAPTLDAEQLRGTGL
jgi:cytochrome c-type biogenesis protein CcmH